MDMVTYAALQKQIKNAADYAIPKKVSAFDNDAGYQNEKQVQAIAAAVEEKIPTVPQNVSSFNNDAQYQSLQQVNAIKADFENALENKHDKMTFDNVPAKNSQNPVTSDGIYTAFSDVIAVANGKCKSYVFDTVSDLETWLTTDGNTAGLKTGDVFLIRDVGVPDYWWDGNTNEKQILETTKVDLSDYALKSQLPTKVSDLANDMNYQTETQVKAATSAVEAKIPTVPSDISHFNNDSGYLKAEQVRELISTEIGLFVQESSTTVISNESAHDTFPTAKAVYDYIESRLNGLILKPAASAPTVNDPNVITFVNVG